MYKINNLKLTEPLQIAKKQFDRDLIIKKNGDIHVLWQKQDFDNFPEDKKPKNIKKFSLKMKPFAVILNVENFIKNQPHVKEIRS